MDFVMVSFGPDMELLRHCLASYELYFQSKDKLILFVSASDKPMLDGIPLPENTQLLMREDFPELAGTNEYSQQHYLKLLAHRFVETDFYCVIDSDFVFIQPTHDRDFFEQGKPRCFFRPWVEGEPALWKRKPSESFLGLAGALVFNTHAEWVFRRSICAELATAFRLEGMLDQPDVSELQIYGMYAYHNHRDAYVWIGPGAEPARPVGASVNQVPPAYNLDLDPGCSFEQFRDYRYVQFWSYWELAERKMIEFFEDSQMHHYGRILVEAIRDPLVCIIDASDVSKGGYRYLEGVYADGWVKDDVKFKVKVPEPCKTIAIELMVPLHPMDPKWECAGTASTDGWMTSKPFNLAPGAGKLEIELEGSRREQHVTVALRFGAGFHYQGNPDPREFRARLLAVVPA